MEQADLFFAPERHVWTVSALLAGLKQMLEREYFDVWVEGEISNLHHSAARHWYFTLKDARGQLRAVLFAPQARLLRFQLRDGLQVRVRGRLSVYEARGDVQCYVEMVEPLGRGGLQLAFEQLKDKLAAEGLFALERKRPLPRLPRRIGLITSPRGAAVADMVRVLQRRFPSLDLLLYPVAVQGEAAAPEIVRALEFFAEQAPGSRWAVDLLIVGRGGGSLEDLWPFNDEAVARALARAPVPSIAAVGHETDFTIADFVADVRAPTPSAAAELAVRPRAEFVREQSLLRQRLQQGVRFRILQRRQRLHDLARHRAFDAVRHNIAQRGQRTDDLDRALEAALARRLRHAGARLERATAGLRRCEPRVQLAAVRLSLETRRQRLESAAQALLGRRRQHLERLAAQLGERNPLAILRRGYALVYDAQGHLAARAANLEPGDDVRLRFADGERGARIKPA